MSKRYKAFSFSLHCIYIASQTRPLKSSQNDGSSELDGGGGGGGDGGHMMVLVERNNKQR